MNRRDEFGSRERSHEGSKERSSAAARDFSLEKGEREVMKQFSVPTQAQALMNVQELALMTKPPAETLGEKAGKGEEK